MNNILFLGQNCIANRCFEVLVQPKYSQTIHVCGIVSNKKDYTEWKNHFDVKSLPVFISNTLKHEREIIGQIKSLSINLIISIQHPWILSKQVLDSAKGFAFNLHNAKLPDYKGYNSISHAILNGEHIYTSTIHWMIPDVDMGDIAYEKSIISRSRKGKTRSMLEYLGDAPQTFNCASEQESDAAQRQPKPLGQMQRTLESG